MGTRRKTAQFWAKAADVSREFFNASHRTGDGTDAGPESLRRDFGSDGLGWKADAVRLRLVAKREQLECRLLVVAEGRAGDGAERPDPEVPLLSEGIDKFVDQYTLDGKPLSTRHSVGMVVDDCGGALCGDG